jgi:hypothetical protein
MATALIVIPTMEHSDFTMTMKKSRLASQNTTFRMTKEIKESLENALELWISDIERKR